jgi:hypothetical protein
VLDKLWDKILAYLESRPYWQRVEPFAAFAALLVAVSASTYEYIEWRYHLSLPPEVFLSSYVFRQILLCFAAAALLLLIFRRRSGRQGGPELPGEAPAPVAGARPAARWTARLRQGAFIRKLAAAALVVAILLAALVRLSPARASRIRVRFLDEAAGVDQFALTYLLYELNKAQDSWQYEVDVDPFNPQELKTADRAECGDEPLCLAGKAAGGLPFIGITARPLGDESAYWQNRDNASVISVERFTGGTAPGVYEYLAYTLVVQSVVIHLNRSCGDPSAWAFKQSRVATGDLFDFSPRRDEMRAKILAGHLTPRDQALLLKCFGFGYMHTVSQLVTLDWLRGKVSENLARAFGVHLDGVPPVGRP